MGLANWASGNSSASVETDTSKGKDLGLRVKYPDPLRTFLQWDEISGNHLLPSGVSLGVLKGLERVGKGGGRICAGVT